MANSERPVFLDGEEIIITGPISGHNLCRLLRVGYSTLVREVIGPNGIQSETVDKYGRIAPEQANLIVQLTAQARAEGKISPIRDLDSQVPVELR